MLKILTIFPIIYDVKQKRTKYRQSLSIGALLIFLLSLVSGCATYGKAIKNSTPQVIEITEKLSVHLYSSLEELRREYLIRGGDPIKGKRILGFYSEKDNSIHCLKWDFYTCGHELFHSLQYKGDTTLLVEKGFEHFKEHAYTSP